ncbi:MAG: extracellular solute-binding protein, partial [Lachnospiraceae bacterium]|nr:extracellular solute-binding protein [Lachnospiraceae bacterium]
NQYVDLREGKCTFGDGDFKELLEFANANFPESLSDDYYNDDYFNNYETRFMNDNALLYQTNMYSAQDMVSTLNGTFGGEGMFVGLPSSDHSKAVAAVYNRMAISAKSEYVSGAWAFLKYYLTDEYQDSIKYDVPIKESSFRKFLDAGKEKPYYMDNDRKVEYDYSFWAGDKSITIDPLSDEQIADIENTIRGIKRLNWSNDNISNIITEEVPAYFSGQKSVDDVVNIIQNRAQIYVDENY